MGVRVGRAVSSIPSLAEGARSECAPSMRAARDRRYRSPNWNENVWGEGLVRGRQSARSMHAVEDQWLCLLEKKL